MPLQKEVLIGVFAWYALFSTQQAAFTFTFQNAQNESNSFDLSINQVLLVRHQATYLVLYTCTP